MMSPNLATAVHALAVLVGLCGCAGAVGDGLEQQNFAEARLDVEASSLGATDGSNLSTGGEELGGSATTASVGPEQSHQSDLDTEVGTRSGVEGVSGGDEDAGGDQTESEITETESSDGDTENDDEATTQSVETAASGDDAGDESGGETEAETDTESEESGDEAVCGDGIVNTPYELCDGDDLGDFSCQSEGFDLGSMACTPRCWIDPADCRNHPQPDTGVYADCLSKACAPENLCVEIVNGDGVKIDGYCSKPCVDAPDCPGSPGGTARPVCVGGSSGEQLFCALHCAGGLTCPDGMKCTPLVGGAMHCI